MTDLTEFCANIDALIAALPASQWASIHPGDLRILVDGVRERGAEIVRLRMENVCLAEQLHRACPNDQNRPRSSEEARFDPV